MPGQPESVPFSDRMVWDDRANNGRDSRGSSTTGQRGGASSPALHGTSRCFLRIGAPSSSPPSLPRDAERSSQHGLSKAHMHLMHWRRANSVSSPLCKRRRRRRRCSHAATGAQAQLLGEIGSCNNPTQQQIALLDPVLSSSLSPEARRSCSPLPLSKASRRPSSEPGCDSRPCSRLRPPASRLPLHQAPSARPLLLRQACRVLKPSRLECEREGA